jgi:tryptophan-rich sensory protein
MKPNYIIIPLITIAVAVIGSLLTNAGMVWYQSLELPPLAPAGFYIGLVWTIVFILSTISAIIIWNSPNHDKFFWWIIGIFIANAVLNVLWSYLFFFMNLLGSPIIEMIFLELSVLALCILIWPRSKTASILLWPYAAWVIFATYLAISIWQLNVI